jgi:hypothetical protein
VEYSLTWCSVPDFEETLLQLAEKQNNGTYEMVGSDFLNSFVRKMAGKERGFLSNLLNNQKLSASLSGHV